MVFSGEFLTRPILIFFIIFSKKTQARFCDGGHKCLPPKECCPQGCCYLFAPPPTAPRPTTPTIDHVLNLFFINHWYFWCFVLAIVLALLCVCSLWKKRRQLCGWGSSGPNYHSEGDSTGSCYAPPQYSRCNSFHHAPPPYMEVTSKPDLYPLVFSYTSDGGKGGTNYLMVQYFRNYIVRPVGSLSATSTVDSLSSSFIRSSNEANTLVPPPYSRATSPDLSFSFHNNSSIPRSASQQACSLPDPISNVAQNGTAMYRPCSVPNSNMHYNFRLAGNEPISEFDSIEFHQFNENLELEHQQQRSYNSYTSSMAGNGRDASVRSSVNEVNVHNNDEISLELVAVSKSENGSELDPDQAGLNKSLSHYRKALRQHKEHKDTSFESKESHICDYIKVMNRSYLNSNTDSSVSSLVNLGSPASPPCPTSPTSEVREILEQIRQIQSEADNAFFDTLDELPDNGSMNSLAHYTASFKSIGLSPSIHSPNHYSSVSSTPQTASSHNIPNFNPAKSLDCNHKVRKPIVVTSSAAKTNRSLYLPIATTSTTATQNRVLRSSMTSNCILSRNRGNKRWISKSAPTTPGTTTIPNIHIASDDVSPLLTELEDEDPERND